MDRIPRSQTMQAKPNVGIEEQYGEALTEQHRRRLDRFTADNTNIDFLDFVNFASGRELLGEMNNQEARRIDGGRLEMKQQVDHPDKVQRAAAMQHVILGEVCEVCQREDAMISPLFEMEFGDTNKHHIADTMQSST